MKSNIGLVWLAVMWANLARNIANKWFKISVYNRTATKTQEFIQNFWNENLVWKLEIKDFLDSLESPRKVIIMVKAWEAVDETISQLIPFLDKWDIIIDWGNSYYKDTIRRYEYLKEIWLKFIWSWVSGWEEWALNWPSIMPGWEYEDWVAVKPVFEAIAAKDFDWQPCVCHIWENWAGHYVKMVHNGIEYAIMQMMAEAYESLKLIYWLNASEISQIFKKFNSWKLNSYLFEISSYVLDKKDQFNTDKYLIDYILDKAWNKGTWKRTAMDALDRGVAVPSITQAVYARYISAQKDLRVDISSRFQEKKYIKLIELQDYVKVLEDGLYLWMLSAYAQWYDLINVTAQQQNWHVNLAEISRIWEWGCIIRAKILKILHQTFAKSGNNLHLLQIPDMVDMFEKDYNSFIRLISVLSETGISNLALSSALSYFLSMKSKVTSANFIQWQRDYFGAHTYERTDRDWIFHTDWEFEQK